MRKRGFSLLEVLIAMSILSIGVFGAMKLFPMTLRQVRAAHERTVAYEMAEGWFAALRSSGSRSLWNLSKPALDHALEQLAKAEDVYIVKGRFISVTPVSAAEQVWLHRSTFSVKMPDGRYERFVTVVAEP